MRDPSGDQRGPKPIPIFCCPVPSASITHSSRSAAPAREKAMRVPSGDQAGKAPPPRVCAVPVARSITTIDSLTVKTICPVIAGGVGVPTAGDGTADSVGDDDATGDGVGRPGAVGAAVHAMRRADAAKNEPAGLAVHRARKIATSSRLKVRGRSNGGQCRTAAHSAGRPDDGQCGVPCDPCGRVVRRGSSNAGPAAGWIDTIW